MPEKRNVKSVSIDISPALWRALSFLAAYQGRPKRALIEEALRIYLEVNEVEKHGVSLEDEEDDAEGR